MVEVTKSNFEDMMPDIKETIHSASFIAIDAEFTGLKVGQNDNFSYFDSMYERYQKLKLQASSFTITQIGLSAFARHPTKNCYQVKTYVFYIRPYLCGDIDRRFMCQASCIDFLCRFDFDFNKVFKEGIPFINETQEQRLSEGLANENINCEYNFLSREDDMLINEELLQPAKNNNASKRHRPGTFSVQNKRVVLEKDKLYPPYFQLIQIRKKYPTLHAYEEGDKIIVEKTHGKMKKQDLTVAKENALEFFLGFTKVFRLLKDSQKPIVGHNFLMDLLLCFHNFHQPLPDKFEDFKMMVHSVFPRIYDTRQIWRNIKKHLNVKNLPTFCGLFELYEIFKRPPSSITTLYNPSIECCNGAKYAEGEFPHEAGYDSYVTGKVFINICHMIAMKKAKNPVFVEPQTFKQHLNAVSPFENKVNLARSRYMLINFAGEDPQPCVPELLHICKKNNDFLCEAEISSIFEEYGTVDLKIMKNQKQAIAAVGSVGLFRNILTNFKNDNEWDITEYNMLKHSPYLKKALWLASWICKIGSACVIAFLLTRTTTKYML